jgi:hypothetical protein
MQGVQKLQWTFHLIHEQVENRRCILYHFVFASYFGFGVGNTELPSRPTWFSGCDMFPVAMLSFYGEMAKYDSLNMVITWWILVD